MTFFCISSLAYCQWTFFFSASAVALALVSQAFELLDRLGEDDLVVVRKLISSFSIIKIGSPKVFRGSLSCFEIIVF